MVDEFPTGCVLDEAATDAVTVAMAARGRSPVFGDAKPSLNGHWSRLKARGVQAVLLPDVMNKYFPGRGADYQRAGTCVGRGTYRAITMSYLKAVDDGRLVGRPVIVAYEPTYADSRVRIGKGRISGDGSVGAWAAESAAFGVVERARFGEYDLSDDSKQGRESLAVEWGKRGRGVPREILEEMRLHPVTAHRAMNVDHQMDCLAAGYSGAFCRGKINGKRDRYGMSRPERGGAHCEAVVGVFLAHNGEDGILMWQSWNNQPSGGPDLVLADGRRWTLPQGCYGIMAEDQRSVWRSFAESWHFEIDEGSQWR